MTEDDDDDRGRDQDDNRVLARLYPSAPRRIVGTGILAALGGLLVWVGFRHPPAEAIWQAFLLLTGGLALWLAVRLWQSTAQGLELTAAELRETGSGRVLARFDEIEAVDRGPFAVKPTAGFALRLRRPGPRAWMPGLWWRVGRRVGVGGVTHRHEARFMAELLDERLKRRAAGIS